VKQKVFRQRRDVAEEVKAIASPCVRNCCLNVDDLCMGCFRSIDEITSWNAASEEEKRAILKRCEARSVRTAEW